MLSALLLSIPLTALTGCEAETLSQSWQIDRTRILGVKAEPAEPAPGDTVIFSSLVVHPEFEIESVVWFGCLADGASSFCCDLSGLEALEGEELSEDEINEILASAEYFGYEPDFLPPYTPDAALLDGLTEEQQTEGTNLLLTLSAIPVVEGRELDEALDVEIAYKRVPISLSPTPNTNPAIEALAFDGETLAPGGILTLARDQTYTVEPLLSSGSVETYTYIDEDGNSEEREEEPYFTYYVTHGTPSVPYSLFPYGVDYTADFEGEGPVDATLWAVVRDRRGGMGWYTQALRIE